MTTDYPTSHTERQALRDKRRAELIAAAEEQATKAGLSMKCAGQALLSSAEPVHRHDPGGCKDDGSGCLCECHDDQRVAAGGGA